MESLALVAIGGAVGSVARFLLSGWVQRLSVSLFPVGTLFVNLSGSFLMGICAGLFFGPFPVREEYRLMVMTGFLGGFTTFSAYAYETVSLAAAGDVGKAAANVMLSNGLCLLVFWAGYRAARALS